MANDYDRILYLDADVYVHSRKIFDLFGLDMLGYSVAGVRDVWVTILQPNQYEKRRTITNRQGKYLNTGVMLIDVARFEERNLRTRTVSTIRAVKEQLVYMDQSAINMVLDGEWLELSPGFNTLQIRGGAFLRDVCEPTIAHFAGSEKPWHGPRFTIEHRARRELELFAKSSPWKGFLAQFYHFDDAWKSVAQNPRSGRMTNLIPDPLQTAMKSAHFAKLSEYLRETPFADVEQGISERRLDRLPLWESYAALDETGPRSTQRREH